jgi:hypothetical protein
MIFDQPHPGLDYKKFIFQLCLDREVGTYLEVGVEHGFNLANVVVDTAFGVDPALVLRVDPTAGKKSLHLYKMTSDLFFKRNSKDIENVGLLDFSFLDGMHLFEYLLRDILNTEALSKQSGLIALHDCLPFNGEMIERVNNYKDRTPGPYADAWTGDVWKIIPILEEYRPDLSVVLIDCAPTGLVCISGLDPDSTVLKDRYLEIVNKYRKIPNNLSEIENLYSTREIVRASDVLSNFNQTLYFRA